MAASCHFISPLLQRAVALCAVLIAAIAIQNPALAQSGSGVQTSFTALGEEAGTAFPWEGNYSGTNTSNGNKLTSLPLVSWTARGGFPVNLTLYHNSQKDGLSELGYRWTHSYGIYLVRDPSTYMISVQWGSGLAYHFNYSGGTYSSPTGVYDALTYTGTGASPTSFTIKTKSLVSYYFVLDSGNRWKCTSITDPNGNALTIAHNASGNVTSVTDGNGRALNFAYTGTKITSITDPTSRVFTLGYTSDDLTSVTFPDPDGAGPLAAPVMGYGYNAAHRITSITDPRSKVWTFSYDSSGAIQWEQNPLSQQTTYTYTSTYARITDARSFYVQHNYTSGRLISVRDELNYTESYTYDSANNRTQVTDKAGKLWIYTYDSRGNVLTAKNPYNKITTYTYNSLDLPLTKTTSLGYVWTWTYDTAGNRLTEKNPLNQTTTYAYGTYGLLSTVTTPLSHTTTYYYDTYGNVNGVTDATSRSTPAIYDTLGRKTSATVDTLTTTYAYDNLGRLTSVTLPGSRTTSYVYDAAGNKTGVTNALSQSQSFTYDDAGRLSGHTDALSRSISYGYNATGQKTSFTDGRGKITTYTIDGRGDVTGIGYADGKSESWTYSALGKVATHTDGRGIVTTNTYDNAARLTGISYSSGASSVTFAYDDDSRKTSMVDGTGTTTYTYDNANRLTGRATPQGSVLYTYNSEGLKTSEGVNLATPTTFTYDNAGRMLTVVAPSGTTTYTYDTPGRVATVTNANNSVETRTYDATTGDLLEIWHRASAAGATLQKFTYTHDSLGRKATETTPTAARTWGYDAAGQLTSEVRTGASAYSTTFTYDNAGNRLTKNGGMGLESYTYNDANLLTGMTGGAAGRTFTYDNDGNTTSITTGGVTVNLTWDGAGRLTQVSNGTYTDTSTYNGLGQRVGKVDSTGTSSLILADDRIDSDVLSDGLATYQHGLGLVSEVRGGVTRAYHADALGSTRVLSGASGAVSATREMSHFGKKLTSTGTQSPFSFAGQSGYQNDPDSEFMRLGHRFYDPSTGRFLSRDPAFAGYNWYIYCNNDPVNRIDPTGLINAEEEFFLGGGGPGWINEPGEGGYIPPPSGGGGGGFGGGGDVVIEGHGSIPRATMPTFEVPPNASVTIPQPGVGLTEGAGQAMAQGNISAELGEGLVTYGPGETMPNYTIHPPDAGMLVQSGSITVTSPTPLSSLVTGEGNYVVATCTKFEGEITWGHLGNDGFSFFPR